MWHPPVLPPSPPWADIWGHMRDPTPPAGRGGKSLRLIYGSIGIYVWVGVVPGKHGQYLTVASLNEGLDRQWAGKRLQWASFGQCTWATTVFGKRRGEWSGQLDRVHKGERQEYGEQGAQQYRHVDGHLGVGPKYEDLCKPILISTSKHLLWERHWKSKLAEWPSQVTSVNLYLLGSPKWPDGDMSRVALVADMKPARGPTAWTPTSESMDLIIVASQYSTWQQWRPTLSPDHGTRP